MTAKDKMFEEMKHLKDAILRSDTIEEARKQQVIDKIDVAVANIPDAQCGSPEMVLALSIMRDALVEAMTVLLNSMPKGPFELDPQHQA